MNKIIRSSRSINSSLQRKGVAQEHFLGDGSHGSESVGCLTGKSAPDPPEVNTLGNPFLQAYDMSNAMHT